MSPTSQENSGVWQDLPVMSEEERQFNVAQYERRYRRAKRVAWSVIGVFVTVFVLEASEIAKEIEEKKAYESDSVSVSVETVAKTSLGPGSETLTSLFSPQKLSYRVVDFPPDLRKPASCAPFFTSMLAHGGLLHLTVNSYGFYQLSVFLMMSPLGVPATLGSFLVGGVMASQIACAVEKAYATGGYTQTFKLLKRNPTDPDPQRTLHTIHLGASSGLMALVAIMTLRSPNSAWGFPILNFVSLPAWAFACAGIGWDLWGFYNNNPDGIGHTGHLGGWISGSIIYLVLLRGKYGVAGRMRKF